MGQIKGIEFKMISPQMIKKLAVMEVSTSEVYDVDAYPIDGGVMDPRLGVIDPSMKCRTCGGRLGECIGHFGYIELARPVINILYLKQIKNILDSICNSCGAALIGPEGGVKKGKAGKKTKLKRLNKCPKCSKKAEKVKIEKPSTFVSGKKTLTPIEVRELFEKVSDSDLKLIGLNGGRPEWMILTLLFVPPVTSRPSITLENGDRSEDDLTHKLVDIIRINHRLADNLEIGAPDFIIEDLWELLQYHVTTFFNNEISSIPPSRHRSGRSLKTLSQRLKSKDGRFRHNLTGKRVNFSARSVISPDPNISLNDVGVPEIVAKELTVPIKVTESNLKDMKALVKNGPEVWPGANYIIKADGSKKKLTEETKEVLYDEIKPGYLIERHLQDGDVVLFNRQPSLHRMSVMAHHVKVMPGKTFRLNLCVCKPYNADFDGDEMNMHVPQTAEARAEAEELMLVEKNMRSPRFGGVIMGCDQDYISGAYLITKDGTTFTKEQVAQILTSIGMYPELKKDEYTGKELFSFVIPKGTNCEYKANVYSEDNEKEGIVKVVDGQLVQGVIDSRSIAAFKGKLIDEIDRHHGHEEARKFIDRITRMISEVMMKKGFSISVADLDISKKAENDIKRVIDEQFEKVDKHIKAYHSKKLDVFPGRSMEETLEDLIMRELWEVTNQVQKIIGKEVQESGASIMAKTGARGSIQNLAYMSGIVGQEVIKGGRIFRGYVGRTLAHFQKGDLSPVPHGFVSASFKKGTNPIEFFFEVMKGREGIMDSSLKTRVSGYMQRRLVNALQDIKIDYDYLVKDSASTIIQFIPGEDGVDPAKSDRGTIVSTK